MKKILTIIFLLSFSCFNLFAADCPNPKDDMRMPWADIQNDFICDWLILGSFPGDDFSKDLLTANGGEQAIKPVAGMEHVKADGSKAKWFEYHSQDSYINFMNALKDIGYANQTAYAYTTADRLKDEKAILSFGSNVDAKIWVNGKSVFEGSSGGSPTEGRHIEVNLKKGENSILVKLGPTGWTWGFTMRLIKPESFSLAEDFNLSPSIESNENNVLTIKSDRSLNPAINNLDVNIKVVKAGGKVVSEKTVKRSALVNFNTADWTDGVYDICFRSINVQGTNETDYLYWYKGDALKEAQELIASAPKNPATQNELVHAMLVEMIHDKIGTDLSNADPAKISSIYSPLMEYEELLLEQNGMEATTRANGFTRLAYRDPVDNTPQFCRAYLPLEYDASKKWPLVIKLHGYNGANPVYVKWWSVDSRHYGSFVDNYPVILIEPHGRGNTSYRNIGDIDVVRVIEMAKQQFNVDDDRVYLFGESMGGGGAWHVGTRHPELFAAVAPVYGGWDYHTTIDAPQYAKLTPREHFNFEKNSSFTQAEAMLTTPIHVFHGDADKAVDVNYSRYAVKMLQRWGYDIQLQELPGYGHEGMPITDALMEWFLKHTRNTHPQKVRVRAVDLKTASAHWVKITQREDPYSLIHAEAEALINNTIRLTTENALAVELSPSAPLIDPGKPVTVIWNIDDIRTVKLKDGKLSLQAKNYKPSKLVKRPELEGPISDIITTPFAVVIGTISKDSMMVKLCAMKAQEFIDYWKNFQKYKPRVFKDTEMTDDDIAAYSLLLYGGANDNLVTKKLDKKIPLKISTDEIKIANKSFPAVDACVEMIYPHPLNSERYVSVFAGTSPAGMFHLKGSNNELDFNIYDGCIPNGRLGRTMEKIVIAQGVFDYNWQVSGALTDVADHEIRKQCAVRTVNADLTTTITNLPEISMDDYKKLVGKYEVTPGMAIPVYLENNKLMAIGPNGQPFALYPITATEYFIAESDVQISFVKADDGSIDHFVVYERNSETKAKKIE
ncbi:prolyl oligopeptidase family serine peptidase [candidate division KSB1 bacterium]|nr:prolyl oligopeptidase family serine peptidase [candidate division KSB1 bacterium]